MELNMELEGETLRLNIKMELTFMTVIVLLIFTAELWEREISLLDQYQHLIVEEGVLDLRLASYQPTKDQIFNKL